MRKQHALVTAIALIGLLGGSWATGPVGLGLVVADATASPPPVSAPPPVQPSPALEEERALHSQIMGRLRLRHTGLADRELDTLADTIVQESERYDLSPALVIAVIEVESAAYHRAVSPVGALGLMQLLPSTGEEVAHKLGLEWRGPDSLFDPILNVKLGTAYLHELSTRYGHIPTALAAYNWGPGHIDRRLRRGVRLPEKYPRLVREAHEAWEAYAGRS